MDSFFPILASIEREVKDIDAHVLGGQSSTASTDVKTITESSTTMGGDGTQSEKRHSASLDHSVREKPDAITVKAEDRPAHSVAIVLLDPHVPLLRRFRNSFKQFRTLIRGEKDSKKPESNPVSPTQRTLLKMAATRRIVTSLGRLLNTKGEVVAQIRKRLLSPGSRINRLSLPLNTSESADLAIYMGDVQGMCVDAHIIMVTRVLFPDHIDTLMQSLAHYEHMLSHSHPAYLSQLRVSQALAKGGTDKAIQTLTVISITVLCIQFLLGMPESSIRLAMTDIVRILGLFSMNIQIPTNRRGEGQPPGPFNVFFIVLSIAFVIGVGVLYLFRYWRVQAKRKFSRRI